MFKRNEWHRFKRNEWHRFQEKRVAQVSRETSGTGSRETSGTGSRETSGTGSNGTDEGAVDDPTGTGESDKAERVVGSEVEIAQPMAKTSEEPRNERAFGQTAKK